MGIFNTPATQKAPELTKPEKQVRTKQQVQQISNETMRLLYQGLKNGMKLVWENPYGLTPQEVFDALDVEAAEYLAIAQSTQAFINSQIPDAINTDDLPEMTVAKDGRVLVGAVVTPVATPPQGEVKE